MTISHHVTSSSSSLNSEQVPSANITLAHYQPDIMKYKNHVNAGVFEPFNNHGVQGLQ